jgi:hypothetical protein
LERDGLTVQSSEEWQMWEGKVYIYHYKRGGLKVGEMRVPTGIIRYLNLKHRDSVYFAVKRREEEAEKE